MFRKIIAALAALALGFPALAADNKAAKDSAGTNFTLRFEDRGGVNFPVHMCVTQADETVDCTAATEAGLQSLITIMGSVTGSPTANTIADRLKVINTTLSSALPLPTGASTAAKQDTTNTNLGAPGDTTCATDTGSCSLNAKISRLTTQVTALKATTDSMAADIATIKADTTPIHTIGDASSANIGDVDVVSLPATPSGSNTIGATFGFAGTATTTFNRPADANSYTALDWISDSTSAPTSGGFTLSNMCRISGGSGVITDIQFLSNDTAALAATLYIFDSATSVSNLDNTLESANSLADADVAKLVGTVPFTLATRTLNASVNVPNLNMGYTCAGTANLRFLVQATGGTLTTASANTYTFRVKFIQSN